MIGQTLGPYQVLSKIGEGGMGEVYRARDSRLHREVAIKALPAAVTSDPERVARFEREAQILASLHHPNIAGIHGLEQSAPSPGAGQTGATYLVLEFVDGKPLDAILRAGGALPPDETLAIARQIADAIAAAHEKGIIHRDLKPGNVMVTADGQVKVLDFGLGKSLDDGRPAAGESAAANSPTVTIGATQAGIILGTAGYMSPEQAKGRTADRRSDVWSFGCVLFEMLAGTRAFEGEDITDTIAAVVRGEPNWKALPATTPPALRTLIERCLLKDRTQRLADMSVVKYVLEEATRVHQVQVPGLASPKLEARSPARRVLVLAGVAALSVAATVAVMSFRPGASSPPVNSQIGRFTVVLPDGDEVTVVNMVPLALAPDGGSMVYTGLRAGKTQLFLHDFAAGKTTPIDGTDQARSPFFAPDGRWVAFFSRGKLRKITIGGASPGEIADARDARGGAWGPDDTIYYAPTNTSGLWKVRANGGTAAELTKVDHAAGETSHRNPYALPDGTGLLFMVWTGPGADEHRIEHLTFADGRRQVVARNADGPVTLTNGHLIYAGRQDTLFAAPWNPARPSLEGVEPVTLPFPAQIESEGVAAYAAASNGTLVHLLGDRSRRLARIVWVDRSGRTEALPLPERDYASATISPDGTRAAVQIRGGMEEIWIYDFRTGAFTPFVTPGGSSQAPVWTMDSKSLVYRGTRQGSRNLYRKAADGSDTEERLTTKPDVLHTPTSATTDGKWIIFLEGGLTGGDLMKVALDGPHETQPVIATPASETSGLVSPDGRWIAFDSAVSGLVEVWVKPFDSPTSAIRKISRDGGTASRWSRDGKELYYSVPNGIMVVSVSGDTFGQPRLLFEGQYRRSANANTNYDVSRDGRFLHVQPVQLTKPPTRIEVVLNSLQPRR
jgi:serine/threonine protein kinase/Tol biopolymer transport system component